MTSRHEQKIKHGAAQFLEPGEEILAALIGQPRGHTQQVAGARNLGAAQTRRVHAAAAEAGLRVEAPMALAITGRRLLTLRISTAVGLGIGGTVQELLSAVPLADVEAIEVKKLLAGSRILLTVRGQEIRLECNAAANAKGVAAAFERARAPRRTGAAA